MLVVYSIRYYNKPFDMFTSNWANIECHTIARYQIEGKLDDVMWEAINKAPIEFPMNGYEWKSHGKIHTYKGSSDIGSIITIYESATLQATLKQEIIDKLNKKVIRFEKLGLPNESINILLEKTREKLRRLEQA